MYNVRIGVIGVGGMGSAHCKQIAEGKIRGMTLTAVADIKESRRKWAKENLPETVHIYDNAESLMDLGNVDAIFIVTPHYLHPVYAIEGF